MQLNLRKKFLLSFLSIIFLMLVTAVVSLWLEDKARKIAQEIELDDVPGTVLYLNLIDEKGDMVLNVLEYLTGETSEKSKFEENYQAFNRHLNKLIPLESSRPSDHEKMRQIEQYIQDFYLSVQRDIFSLSIDDPVKLKQAYQRLDELENGIIKPLEKILDVAAEEEVRDATSALSNLSAELSTLGNVIVGLTAAALIASILIAYRLSSSITTRVENLVAASTKVASGDLTAEPIKDSSGDELETLANSVNTMQSSLKTLLSSISSVGNEVNVVTTDIDESSKQVLKGAQQQADKASMIATASEELSATIAEVALQSTTTADMASEAGKSARHGGNVITEVVNSTQQVSTQMNEMSDQMQQLGRRGDEIGSVIKVINDIAEQTNLLALNAAIEAARAGEFGRGFAVVADEVRALAERTSKATQEVGDLIGAIQSGTSQAVSQTERSASLVAEGVSLSAGAGSALNDIVESAENVQSMIQTIATATEEQTAVTQDIATDISVINDIAADSVRLTESSSSRVRDLREKVTELEGLLASFKLN